MADEKKPTGGPAFDKLLGALVQVPKPEIEAAAKRYQKKKAKRKKK